MKNQRKKLVFLIGGSGLIGKEILKVLEKNNFRVINFDIKKYGKNFSYFDCSKVTEIDQTFNSFFSKFGIPGVLINCSYPITKNWLKNDFKNLNIQNIKSNIDSHLLSYTLIANKYAKKLSSKTKNGKIILFSSIYGFLAQNPNNYVGTQMRENITYSIIKAGIINLMKQMAAHYGKKKIEINSISPGAVAGHVKGSKKRQNLKFISKYSNHTPLKRLAKPIEIANLVKFLSSDECSYITGQNIVIDGGYSIT